MQEYKVKRTSVVISVGIFSAVLAAVAGMCFALSELGAPEIKSSAYWVVRWLTPFVCSLLIPAVVNIFRAFRSYRVDSETITRKGLLKETTMRWDEIDDYDLSSLSLRLKDSAGQEILLSRFEPRSAEIADEFDQRLAPIKRRMFARWRAEGAILTHDYRPYLCLTPLLTPALMILFDHATLPFVGVMWEAAEITLFATLTIPLTLLCILPLFFPLFVRLAPDSVTVFRILTGGRKLRFDEIASLVSGPIKSVDLAMTCIQAKDGKSIALDSGTTHQNVLSEYLRERADTGIVLKGRKEFAEKEFKITRKTRLIVLSIVMGIFLAIFVFGFVGARLRLKELGKIRTQGLPAVANVTKLTSAPANNAPPIDVAYYEFQVNGMEFKGSSRVSKESFNTLAIGKPISILYLKNNPKLSMAEMSITQKTLPQELGKLTNLSGGMMALIATVFGLQFILPLSRGKRIASIQPQAVNLDEDGLKRMREEIRRISKLKRCNKYAFPISYVTLFAGLIIAMVVRSNPQTPSIDGIFNPVLRFASYWGMGGITTLLVFSPIVSWVAYTASMKRFASRFSCELADPRLLPVVIDSLFNDSEYCRLKDISYRKLALSMTPGIDALTSDKIKVLDIKSRNTLISLLSRASSQEDLQPFTLAILKATPLFGNRQALGIVRKLSNDSNLIPVLEEARRVLPLLEARINDLRQGEKQELLLPSSAPNDDGLLIPHSGHGETMSAELLRPALPQSEQEINQEEQIEVRDYSAKKEPANINLLWGG